jgi:IS4 transposase
VQALLERFAQGAPVAVMARLGLQRAIGPSWVDEVFEAHRGGQYTRELTFSTVVDLMSLVALGLRPSLHAAAQKAEHLTVSLAALYDKVKRIEPELIQALVQGSAQRLGPVMAPLRQGSAPWLAGYRVRIVDGNHLPASQKRLKSLRSFRGAALPGHSLVVFDPDIGLVTDLMPCEDGHASELDVLGPLLASAQPGELWIGDRLFSTRTAIEGAHARGAAVLFREHGSYPNPTPIAPPCSRGRIETGELFEQSVKIPLADQKGWLVLRRIELVLDTPTQSGQAVIRLLTTLPDSIDAATVARLYRKRWTIEGLFGRLEAALNSEIRTLGYPRAALLAFGLAVIAFNVLAVIETAVAAAHDLQAAGIQISTYYVADDVRADYRGMMIALPAAEWTSFEELPPDALAVLLRQIAAHVRPRTLRKHRGPSKPKPPKTHTSDQAIRRHVATARVLREGKIDG